MMATDKIDDWNWIDAIQMAMPVYAAIGKIYDEESYFDRMFSMYMYTKEKHGDQWLV